MPAGLLFSFHCIDDFPKVFLSFRDFLEAGRKKTKQNKNCSLQEVQIIGRKPATQVLVTSLVMSFCHANWLIIIHFCQLSLSPELFPALAHVSMKQIGATRSTFCARCPGCLLGRRKRMRMAASMLLELWVECGEQRNVKEVCNEVL